MALLDTSTLFRLGNIGEGSFDHSKKLGNLPALHDSFALPTLDEHSPGSERILAGLKGLHDSQRTSRPSSRSRKGKEREVTEELMEGDGAIKASNILQDLWTSLRVDEAGPSRQSTFEKLRTWGTLGQGRDNARHLFSERPGLINAVKPDLHPTIKIHRLQEETYPSRDADITLKMLLEATLGATTSDQLTWDQRKSAFRWTGQCVTDQSSSTSESAAKIFLDIGTAIRRLEMIIDTHSSTPATPTHHALFYSVSTYLTHLKQELSQLIDSNDKNALSWQAESTKLREIHKVAALLCDIMQWPLSTSRAEGLPVRAASLLSHLHAYLLALLSTSPASSYPVLAAAYLLSQSSGPFLGLLHGWLGLSPVSADEDTDPTSQPWTDMGITRTSASFSDNGEPRWKYEFTPRRMPAFIPKESRRTLFEAGKSLRLLRDASLNQHPLCATSWQLQVGWGWDEEQSSSLESAVRLHMRRVRNEIDAWHRYAETSQRIKGSSSVLHLNMPRKERKRIPTEFTNSPSSLSTSLASKPTDNEVHNVQEGHPKPIDPIWAQFTLAPGSHLLSTVSALWAPSPLDSLRTFLSSYSDPANPLTADSPSLSLYISSHLVHPLLEHGKLISMSLVSLYLDELNLLDHYQILRSFFLGADCGFAERVSAALFGKDEAGAGEALGLGKRARTRARLGLGGEERGEQGGVWGIGLGLGLSERARWPPGGAELAYALRTTLLDDEVPREGVWMGIADRISFAVKSLPEDDKNGQRARWLDPQAIEALDFLYLSYSPPQSISPLLPTTLMAKYQSIQNLLLRVGRVKTVVRSLYIDTVHPTPLFDEPIKQGIDSGSRPASRASSRQDRVVQTLFPPGEKASSVLHRLRFRMSGFVTAIERYLLDIAIGANWDIMYRKLDRWRRKDHLSNTTPSTPVDQFEDPLGMVDLGSESDEDDESSGMIQLQSIDSLVVYHHLVLDRILRASLLSPSAGYQVTYKVLMGLFGCILDLGKIVKEMERGFVGWAEGAERVQAMAKDWEEREGIFLHALERLSMRTSNPSFRDEYGREEGDERDLEVLLGRTEGEEGENDLVGADGGDLGELLIRLKFGSAAVGRGGVWKGDAAGSTL